jgi:hypothetical protein
MFRALRKAVDYFPGRRVNIVHLRGRLAWWVFGLALKLAGDNDRIASALMRRRADEIERRALARIWKNVMGDIKDVEPGWRPETLGGVGPVVKFDMDRCRSDPGYQKAVHDALASDARGFIDLSNLITRESATPKDLKEMPSAKDLDDQWEA